MTRYIVKRLLLGIITIFGVIVITFFMMRVLPADAARKWAGPKATPEQVELAAEELGTNLPLPQQLFIFLGDLAQGDLGDSLVSKQPVVDEIQAYFPATLELVLVPTLLAVVLGMILGIVSANKKDHWIDHIARFTTVGAISLPTFWTALCLQLLFYSILNWLPLGGMFDTMTSVMYPVERITGIVTIDCLLTGNFVALFDFMKHLILPGITIALFPLGLVARMTRSAMLEILNEDYIKAARTYGLSETTVLCRYALKNSLGPTVTVVINSIAATLINTFLIEAIFNWPGIGSYIANSITSMDYPVIMGVTILSAILYVGLNLVADIIIALDPRVRL